MANDMAPLSRKIPLAGSDGTEPRADQDKVSSKDTASKQGGLNPAGNPEVDHSTETDAPTTGVDTRSLPRVSRKN